MTNNSYIEVDDSELIESFRKLSLGAMTKIGYDAFSKTLPMIAQSAGNIMASDGYPMDSVGKQGISMRQGFTTLAYKDGTGGSVTALGEYKLKWFVAGTQERWQDMKHGKQVIGQAHRYLGAIQPNYALEQGYDAVEGEFHAQLEEIIMESIDRLTNGNK